MSERYRAKVRKLGLGEDPMKKEEAGVAKTQQDHPVYAAMIESVDEGNRSHDTDLEGDRPV